MRIRYVIAAIVLAACGLQPAGAADLAQLDCPVSRLSEQERAAFVEAAGVQAPRCDPRFLGFLRMGEECARSHGWSQSAADHALLYNLAVNGQAGVRRRLEGMGIDVASVERALLADTALIAATGSGRFPEEQIIAFNRRLQPFVEETSARLPAGTDFATPLGTFIVLRAIMESSRTQFAAD